MYFLFSGEGATDVGGSKSGNWTGEADDLQIGPIVIIVDRLFKHKFPYSFHDIEFYGFISKTDLADRSKKLKSISLPGSKRPKETAYFFKNARALGEYAKELTEKKSSNRNSLSRFGWYALFIQHRLAGQMGFHIKGL